MKKDAQHNLANFTLLGNLEVKEGKDTLDFAGENYSNKRKDNSLFINMGTHERNCTK